MENSKELLSSFEKVLETHRKNRVRNQMNSQVKRTERSGHRWQRVTLALAACVCVSKLHFSKFGATKPCASPSEVMAVFGFSAQMLAENLRKCLSVSVLGSAVAIRVRSMIT